MARTKPAFTPRPRILTSPHQVAALLGRGEEWFRLKRPKLEAAGFPHFDTLLGGWDSAAIDVWLDRRAGLERHSPSDCDPNPWDKDGAPENGQGEPAVC
jgi:hypothetical protein